MNLWNIQAYSQGELITSEVVEECDLAPIKSGYERQGYETRAELIQSQPERLRNTEAAITAAQASTVAEAIAILEGRLRKGQAFKTPNQVREFCQLQIALEVDEYFCGLFLDSQHRLITFEKLFRGTVDGASVYPRVVVRRALELNAAAMILAHNHPSGCTNASSADTRITQRLKDALALIDVRVLDHVIVGTGGCSSMAETGLL